MRLLWRYGEGIYPAKNQIAYKLKWSPSIAEREYIGCKPMSFGAVWDLLAATKSI
jgi:hypothetical protein